MPWQGYVVARGCRSVCGRVECAGVPVAPLLAGVVLALGVPLQLLRPEVHRAQVAGGVALGLVVEVLRVGMTAFAAGGDRAGAYLRAELDRRDEAVAAGAVVAFRAGPAVRTERGQRTPARGGERHRDARLAVVEFLHDVAVDALEAVDLAPRHAPAAEVLLQAVGSFDQRMQACLRAGLRGHP